MGVAMPANEQEQGDGDDQAEIVGKHVRLVALVEIDDQRPTRLAAEPEGERKHGKMRRRARLGTPMHGDLGVGERPRIGKLAAEIQSGLAAGEGEAAGFVVELVAEHAGAISGMLEHGAQIRREPRPAQGVEQGTGLLHYLSMHALRSAATSASRSSSIMLIRLGATKTAAAINALSRRSPTQCPCRLRAFNANMRQRRSVRQCTCGKT